MRKYYFTYGTDGTHPYFGGWTEVEAANGAEAVAAFHIFHPKRNGLTPCAGIYNEEQFSQTPMAVRGNFGKRCVEYISLNRELLEKPIEQEDT